MDGKEEITMIDGMLSCLMARYPLKDELWVYNYTLLGKSVLKWLRLLEKRKTKKKEKIIHTPTDFNV